MRILGICGSPRENGNTSFLMRTMIADLKEIGVEADYLMLCDLNIQDCNGCLVCEETTCTGYCSINDDMQQIIIPKILCSDAIVLGTPSYFDLPSAQLKRFMDRTNMVLTKIVKKKLQYGIVVVGQTEIDSLKSAYNAVRRYCAICEMQEVLGSPVLAIARDIGDIQKNVAAIDSVKMLGRELAKAN